VRPRRKTAGGILRPVRNHFLALAMLLASAPVAMAVEQSSEPIASRTVVVPSSDLHLKALLWTPAGSGRFPGVLFSHGRSDDAVHTGGLEFAEAAERLGPVFVRHGYAFLYLFRRGEGLSGDQGSFIGDILQREEASKGEEARTHLQFVLLTTDHLDDVIAGLSFLKSQPRVDPNRIAVVGHSFGGQLTLLAAERDSSLRAAVAFAAAAGSWEGSYELRERLLTAVRKTTVPTMLLYAANDYSVVPGQVLARLAKLHLLKIYPPVGQTSDDGHAAVYTAVAQWEDDVFRFLDEYVGAMGKASRGVKSNQ
jgi:carboxymethylenebutenolidase